MNNQDIAHEMRRLAAGLAVDDRRRLALSRSARAYIEKLSGEIARRYEAVPAALSEGVHMLQVCARRAWLDSGARLPSCGGRPRIYIIAEYMLSGGDRCPDGEDIRTALEEYDRAQGLTIGEYWAFPGAMRICLCETAANIARCMLKDADDRLRARDWAESDGEDDVSRESIAFFAEAMQVTDGMPELYMRLVDAISRRDLSTEKIAEQARARHELASARISNIVRLCRILDDINWCDVFEASSHTEAELRRDPSGAYPGMTAESRDAVRKQLAVIARRLGVGELTAARYAVNAAHEATEGNVRRCVCWWIYDDDGRRALAQRLGKRIKLPRMRPDPKGYGIMGMQIAATLAISIFFAGICGSLWWLMFLLPPVWVVVSYFLAQLVTRIVKPRPVLRLEFEKLPDDARTLVAVPALITTPERGRSLCRKLEIIGCLEKDVNLEFVLLGDHPDSNTCICDTDAAVIDAVRSEIARMNAAAGREKYHYLHRGREYAQADGIWRGKERKRGALMALCRLASGRSTGEFTAEGAAERHIYGRFRYILTLDADTKLLPGTAHALAGAIAHPLNAVGFDGLRRRGFAVMQPRMELDAKECTNEFIRIFAGSGGMSTYSGVASDMFHDLTGSGAYCGKAIIDAPAFLELVEDRLEPQRILSHDFIEGALAGAGCVNDISLFDGFPENYQKYLSRLARWTRGDWQLIPDILRHDIPLLARFRMFFNIVDSLRDPALLVLLIFAIWLDNAPAFGLGLLLAFATSLCARILGDRKALTRACTELAVLPAAAYARVDAISRALWRTFVSGRRLLEWVTSADCGGDSGIIKIACRTAAILVLPGLVSVGWFGPAAALIALFLAAPGMLSDMAAVPACHTQKINGEQRAMLNELARETWRFFELYVDEQGNWLPPDNVQLEPGPMIARRTSPTNIGMYMLSCVCARDLGFIESEEMHYRLARTAGTLERMEKWRGHIYNWYDIDTLNVLPPAHISSVDSGNLAAALLACANACGEEALTARLRALAENMDMTALYDDSRKLFYISYDVPNETYSASYYDLMASEARILSYTSIMLGQAPVKHWQALGRPCSDGVLMSWSGTMFEYLMPPLVMPSAPGTLLYETYAGLVKEQMKYASRRSRPWGVSESGYYNFDAQKNYQYHAFGMRALSMSGSSAQDVVAPYAACLALCVKPRDAAENIMIMRRRGWAGECGLFEAIDFVRNEPRVVKSWMSHHQGMVMCAIANILNDDMLHGYFMNDVRAKAVELLLNEKAAPRIKLKSMPDIDEKTRSLRDKEAKRYK